MHMNGEKAQNIGNGTVINGSRWHPLLIALVGSIVGASGSVAVVFGTPAGESLARPDPFTGAQGRSLEQRIDRIEYDVQNHVTAHPDKINQFDRRITVLETQYSNILSNQQRIIEQLDHINNRP